MSQRGGSAPPFEPPPLERSKSTRTQGPIVVDDDEVEEEEGDEGEDEALKTGETGLPQPGLLFVFPSFPLFD